MSRNLPSAGWLLVWAAAAALFLFLYAGLVDAWWMGDDTQHLLSVARNGIGAHFWRPHALNGLTPVNLTPWLYLEYGVDWAIGGLDPRFAYRHHLVTWLLALGVFAFLLVRLLGPLAAALALLLWLPSEPVGAGAQFLSTRHYLAGLAFSSLAILAFIAWERRPGTVRLAAVALFYALAASAKEVYVPLGPALLVAHAIEQSREFRSSGWSGPAISLWRAAGRLWPLLVILAAYVAWRAYMLGWHRLVAGYDEPQFRTTFADVLNFPATAGRMFHGNLEWAALALLVVLAGTVVGLGNASQETRRRTLLMAAAIAMLVLVPIYPVLGRVRVNPNYLFLPSLLWMAWLGWSLQSLAVRAWALGRAWQRLLGAGVAAAVAVALATGQARAHAAFWLWSDRSHLAQGRLEGEAALSGNYPGVIVNAQGPSWHHGALRDLQRDVLARPGTRLTQLCAGRQCEDVVREVRAPHCFRFEPKVRQIVAAECRSP